MSRISFCSGSNEFTQRLFDEVEVIVAQEHFITLENCRRREDAASYERRGVLVESMPHIVVTFYREVCPFLYFLQYYGGHASGQTAWKRASW
jgi:hypothetical protein